MGNQEKLNTYLLQAKPILMSVLQISSMQTDQVIMLEAYSLIF